jgi:serine/threonine protein kinase
MEGTILEGEHGKYEVGSSIGKGGMGFVWEGVVREADGAIEEVEGGVIALKTVGPEHITADGKQHQKLVKEAGILKTLDHPHIVKTFDLGISDGIYFVAMERMTQSFRDKARESVQVEDILELVFCIGSAIEYAHGKGIKHRDLHPANFLYAPDGTIKLGDFGMAIVREDSPVVGAIRAETNRLDLDSITLQAPQARALAEVMAKHADTMDTEQMTRNHLIGVRRWLPPEAKGEIDDATYDERSDLFSLANIGLSYLRKMLPNADAVDILRKGMLRFPNERYQSVGEMLDLLRQTPYGQLRNRFYGAEEFQVDEAREFGELAQKLQADAGNEATHLTALARNIINEQTQEIALWMDKNLGGTTYSDMQPIEIERIKSQLENKKEIISYLGQAVK